MVCRVNGASVEFYVACPSTRRLTRVLREEGQNFRLPHPVMRIESFRANSHIFGSHVWEPKIVMDNRSRDLTILWSDDNNLVGKGPNPNRPVHSKSCRANGIGPSGEWFRTHISLQVT